MHSYNISSKVCFPTEYTLIIKVINVINCNIKMMEPLELRFIKKLFFLIFGTTEIKSIDTCMLKCCFRGGLCLINCTVLIILIITILMYSFREFVSEDH